jgi:hypothetical protein
MNRNPTKLSDLDTAAQREMAALCALEAIKVLAIHDAKDLSDDAIELRCFAEGSLFRFIEIVDEGN